MTKKRLQRLALGCLGLCSLTLATGCQLDVNGQTLPSGFYLQDDIQYFPPGPEFKLLREATAMQAERADSQPGAQNMGPE